MVYTAEYWDRSEPQRERGREAETETETQSKIERKKTSEKR